MCDDPDYYYTVQESRERKARKQHVCCACDEPIRSGHKYVASFALGGDAAESYKHCLRCWAMLSAILAARPGDAINWALDCGEDWRDSIGDLPSDVAALAFLTPEEAQTQLAATPVHRLVSVP